MEVIASDKASTQVLPMYRALVGLGIACAVLIVAVYLATAPVILKNEAEQRAAAILGLLPAAVSTASFAHGAEGWHSADPAAGQVIHVGYTATGELAGMAIEASGMGYQDTIFLMYGYDPAHQNIVGMTVLRSRETPGLGDRIQTYQPFVDNFKALDVSLASDGLALQNPITLVKQGEKQHPWEIDGISGATVSSQAVADILKSSAAAWLPLIHGNIDQFAEHSPRELDHD